MPDRHAKDLAAFRLDPDLRARLKARAEEEGVTMTGYVSEAIEEKLKRGITTTSAGVSPPAPPVPVPVAAPQEQPQAKGKRANAPAAAREPESAADIVAALRRRNGGQR